MRRTGFLAIAMTFLFAALIAPGLCFSSEEPQAPPVVPVPGMATMVDLGADKCIPCKMMAPIIKELQEDYQGRAAIIFIDIWKNRDQGTKFGVRAIPTQIFFDRDGREYHRHEGFLDRGSIISILEQAGVKRPEIKE